MLTNRLTALQRELVLALANRNSGFFLTGGGVLVGYVLGHRSTDDLDLFTTDDAVMAQVDVLARELGVAVNATVESLQTTPDHRRYLFSRCSRMVACIAGSPVISSGAMSPVVLSRLMNSSSFASSGSTALMSARVSRTSACAQVTMSGFFGRTSARSMGTSSRFSSAGSAARSSIRTVCLAYVLLSKTPAPGLRAVASFASLACGWPDAASWTTRLFK